MKRFSIIATIVVLFGSFLTANAQNKTLTVLCTPQEDWCVAMTQAFQKETGIETSYVRLSSGEALARIRATTTNPEFSVWWGGPADAFIAATKENLLEVYASPNADAISEGYKGKDSTWTGVYVGALGFCSNVELLKELNIEAPTSWEDLLDPALEGNVAMAHPATSGTAFTAFWTVVTLEADKLEAAAAGTGYEGEIHAPTQAAMDNAFAYFTKLNKNILQYTRSGAAPGTMAGGGEVAVAIIFSHDCVKLQVEGFKDVLVSTFPAEGTGYEIGGMAILKNAPELDTAKMWYDWALTADAQAIAQTVNSLQLPTNPKTPISELSVKLNELKVVDYNFQAAGANRTTLVERFDKDVAPTPKE